MTALFNEQNTINTNYYSLVAMFSLGLFYFFYIDRGSKRMAEVAARFTLDVMPIKGMAIDVDLNAGVIDIREAKSRRAQLQKECDMYATTHYARKIRNKYLSVMTGMVGVFSGIVYLFKTYKEKLKWIVSS